jgi:hypothetical protein
MLALEVLLRADQQHLLITDCSHDDQQYTRLTIAQIIARMIAQGTICVSSPAGQRSSSPATSQTPPMLSKPTQRSLPSTWKMLWPSASSMS